MIACFTSDLHGEPALFDQLDALLAAIGAELVILGGDVFADVDRARPLAPQIVLMERDLLGRIAAWRRRAPQLAVACVGGNHELRAVRDLFRPHHAAGTLVLLDHRRAWMFGGCGWLGYSCTPPTPHWAKDYERLDRRSDLTPDFPGQVWDAERGALIDIDFDAYLRQQASIEEELAAAPTPAGAWILVAHAPPYDSRLDRLPSLSEPLGSRAVREFILSRQPVLSLHGHFHDSPEVTGAYRAALGRTVCVNPGQGRGRLHAVWFDVARPVETLRHTVLG